MQAKQIGALGSSEAARGPIKLRSRQLLKAASPQGQKLCLARTGLLIRKAQIVDRRAIVSKIIYPGDLFTQPEVTDARGIETVAVVPSQVCWIDQAAAGPDATRNMIDALAWQCERELLHARTVSTLSPVERVASFLIEYGARLGTPVNDGVVFELVLSRLEIADYLILNGDTVSRVMARMKANGVLSRLIRKRVLISDRARLHALSPLAHELSLTPPQVL